MIVKDQVKGMVDDAAGRAKRQVGEWTGDTDAQIEGTAQQIKGKVEKALGNVKDTAKDRQNKLQQESYKGSTEHPATKLP